MDLIAKIRHRYEHELLQETSRVYSQEELEEKYRLFQERFGPDKLRGLDGQVLLETLFDHGNRESLVYWLEFKNDDQFNTTAFGGIAGGSAFKFGIYRRKEDGKWITGNPKSIQEVDLAQAIEIGREIRNLLVKGAETVAALPDDLSDQTYQGLQQDLEEQLGPLANWGWVHKYYHLLYPGIVDDYHSPDWQSFYLIKMQQAPLDKNARYSNAGRLLRLAGEANLDINSFTTTLRLLFGPPHRYWRIGTTHGGTGQSFWHEMRQNGYISVGWLELGDMSELDGLTNPEARDRLKELISQKSTQHPTAIGKSAKQFLDFYRTLSIGDIVVAVQGQKFLGIGRVTGDYEYREGLTFAHTRAVEWLLDTGENLPDPKEGLQTTISQYHRVENLLEIERRIGGVDPVRLEGPIKRMQGILERKKQVVLYGPPGTGKTYWAEQTALELAARKAFNKSFATLDKTEQEAILGTEMEPGLVRFCCFHPSFGYEDFVEGIRASVVDRQTVYSVQKGVFARLCEDAVQNTHREYYLIIDEINRGDISRIFGELITLLEAEKRGKKMILPLSGKPFHVPPNVYVIGTMNTADRSIALLDVALRRRFGFYELMPDYSLFDGITIGGLPLGLWLQDLNRRIVEHVGKDARNLQIGHAYFMHKGSPIKDLERLRKIVAEDVLPLLEEYCYGDYATVAQIIGRRFVDVERQKIEQAIFQKENELEFITALLEPNPTLATSFAVGEEDQDEGEDPNEATGEQGS